MPKPSSRIQVVPALLEQASADTGNIANLVRNARGELAAGAIGESGCDPAAQGAFAAMQAAWSHQLGFIMASVDGLRTALGGAADAYPSNDEAQFVNVWLPAQPGSKP